jgi:very-short-patch-repair endonuclease
MAEHEDLSKRSTQRLRVARISVEQLGLVTCRQLHGLGLSERSSSRRLRSGQDEIVHRGVHRVTGAPGSYEQEVLAACLATGGVASHRCAARLHGLRGFDREERVELTVSSRRASRLEGVTAHETRFLESTILGGIPVATVEQTLLGLADVAPRKAEGAVNSALVKRLTALPRLVQFAGRHSARGRGGLVVLRGLIEEQVRAGGATESWLEDQVVEFLRQRGFPPPVRQYRVGRWRLDLAWPERMVNFEADGRLWHTSPSDRRRDVARDAALGGIGFRIERIGWLELNEDPDGLEARLWRCYGNSRRGRQVKLPNIKAAA